MSRDKIRLQEAGDGTELEDDSLEADLLEAFESFEGGEDAVDPRGDIERPEPREDLAEGAKEASKVAARPQAEPQTDDKPIDPPSRFNSDEKEAFKSLPREAQKAVARLEEASRRYHSSTENELNTTRARYSELERVVAPYEGQLLQRGLSLPQLVEGFIQTQMFAERDPVGAVKAFAGRLGVDPRELIEHGHNGAQQHQVSPELQQLRQELASLKGYIGNQHATQQQQVAQHNVNIAGSFMSATGDDGKLLFPFAEHDSFGNPRYPNFVQRMAQEIKAIKQSKPKGYPADRILMEAYETTSWIDPEARQARQNAELAKQRGEQDRKAREARRAGKSVGNSFGATSSLGSDDDDLDTMIERYVGENYA